MKLKSCAIKNFRGLADVEFSTPCHAAVIVGPNAIGKTSILEAIRLTKCLLMPAYNGEEQQALTSLGIVSPHTQLFSFDSLLGDPNVSLEIRLGIELSEAEVGAIKANLPQLAALHVRNVRGFPPGQEQIALIQYLSSVEGKKFYQDVMGDFQKRLDELTQVRTVNPTLVVDPTTKQISGKDLIDQELVAILGRTQPPRQGLISYFPADRAMPTGEVNIQIGTADIQQQMHSHLGAPATKYHRLKQYIVNQYVTSEPARKELLEDFGVIFGKLLPGKSLESLTLSPVGALSVRIKEASTGASYDIDSMSSGEKGLLLTFLLLRRACMPGGVVLIDEPELHLNPTVTKKVLPFLLDEILRPVDLQALICTHSPEILATAYERTDCTLLHLRSCRDISPILPQDKAEVYEALRRLGAQTSDVLFLRGCIFVEGKHDAELLEHGFPQRVAGYKLMMLGGRHEVEKEIRTLQVPEKEKELSSPQCFIFDLDNRPSDLSSTARVRVSQWDRRCFENYLLDPDVLYDVCKEVPSKTKPDSRSALRAQLRESALRQLKGHVARLEYGTNLLDNPGLRPSEVDALDDYQLIAGVLCARLVKMKEQLSEFEASAWTSRFVDNCRKRDRELADDWHEKWATRADGKRVLQDLHRSLEIRLTALEFKKKVLATMAAQKTELWRTVDSILGDVVPS